MLHECEQISSMPAEPASIPYAFFVLTNYFMSNQNQALLFSNLSLYTKVHRIRKQKITSTKQALKTDSV